MTSENDLWSRLFEPCHKLYPNLALRQLQTKKNKQFFGVFLTCAILCPLLIPLTNLSNETHITNFSLILFHTILYLLLCRSYLWLFHFEYTLFISFAPFALLSYAKETFFFYLGHAFMIPPYIFMMSQSVLFTSFAGCMQIVIFQTKYKSQLIYYIEEMGPTLFAENFMGGICAPFMFLLVMNIFGLRLLHNKTIELFRANKATEDALDQLKTFILSFSHELRNPLNSLLGNLQLVLMTKLSAECSEMVRTAKICGELLLQYINNLLDTGKLEVGNLEVNSVPVNVHELFERVWTISNEIIYRKNLVGLLKIEKQVPPNLLLDPQRITQILMNLIGNAVKFTENGSITTTIQWLKYNSVNEACFEPIPYDETGEGLFEMQENMINLTSRYLCLSKNKKKINLDEIAPQETSSQGILKITVKDTGCGMKKESLKLLFKKFSQVSEDIMKRQIGTGLGLFITGEICRKMKGEIRVYSKEKTGTTFVVCLPTLSVHMASTKKSIYSLEMVSTILHQKNKKAIIVDDSPFNVNLLSSYFTKIGVEVIATANNGQDAFRKYVDLSQKSVQVDIITLDIDMPQMDGRFLFRKIRKFEEDNNRPKSNVVIITGNYDETQVKEGLDLSERWNLDHFFKKPLIFEDFMVVVYDLLMKN